MITASIPRRRAGRTPVTWLVGKLEANQPLPNTRDEQMSHYNSLPPNSSSGAQPMGSAGRDVIDDASQFQSAGLAPANVIQLKPRTGAAIHRGGSQLISLCHEFRALERLSRDRWEMDDPNFWETIFGRQQVLVTKIKATPPRSAAEFKALARALTGWFPGSGRCDVDDLFGADSELLSLLIRGLVETNAN